MKPTIISTQSKVQSKAQSDAQQITGGWYPKLFVLILLVFTALLAACQPIRPVATAPASAAETTAAIAIVQDYYAALNAAVADPGKIEDAMAFLAPDAIFINPTGSYPTLEAIRASLVAGATDGLTFDLTNFREQNGRVVYDYEVKIGDELLDKGADGLTIVKAGKIVFDGTERTDPGTFE